jgi:predicted metal-binding membrane protein
MSWPALRPHLTGGPLPWLLGLAAAGSVATAWSGPGAIPALCGGLERVNLSELRLAMGPQWSVSHLVVGWLVMVFAMMPPLLAQPVLHVWRSSLASRRPRALLLFGCGYAMMWLAAGALLVPAAIGLKLAAGSAAQVVALCGGLAWSCSPIAQEARNACHRMRRVSVFGRTADTDCLRFGLCIGRSCLMACWPWMLVPIMFDEFHWLAMALVSIFLFTERLAPPAPATWRIPPTLVVARSLTATQKVLGKS